jgi:phage terminase large subunit
MPIVQPQVTEKMIQLFYHEDGTENLSRLKVAFGGRGASKSYGYADIVIMRMVERPYIITVGRELESTITASVHQLLIERIQYHDLLDQFHIVNGFISNKATGSTLRYCHLRNNYIEIKGLQGTHLFWLFEAENLSEDSWDVLDPTIRRQWCNECFGDIDAREINEKKGVFLCKKCEKKHPLSTLRYSQILVEFNTPGEDDFAYKNFVVNPSKNSSVVKVNYTDNPMCPKSLIELAEETKRKNPAKYRHIWLGEPGGGGERVYPKYSDGKDRNGRDLHFRKLDFKRIAEHGQCFMAMDPATVYYPFFVWGMRVPVGKDFMVVIYNEFPTRSFFDGKFFHEVRNKEACTMEMNELATLMRIFDRTVGNVQINNRMTARFVDTRFAKASGARSWTTNTQGMIAEFADPKNGGIALEMPPEHTIDAQRDALRTLMTFNENIPICSINDTNFIVLQHCENVNVCMKNHRFNMDNATEDEKYKDPPDAIKILLAGMKNYRYKDPVEEGMKKPFMIKEPEFDFHHALA